MWKALSNNVNGLREKMYLSLAFILIVVFFFTNQVFLSQREEQVNSLAAISSIKRTLVIFAYTERNELDKQNLAYFIRAGLWENDLVDYHIIVSGELCTPCDQLSPQEKRNVQLSYKDNVGFDFGGYNWVLNLYDPKDDPPSKKPAWKHDNYIFLNSGVRGPLLPKYALPQIKQWPSIFTSMLNDQVKLVGASISCDMQIHVQSHFFVLDRAGLDIAWEANIFNPTANSVGELVAASEFGLTNAIMAKGYTIDSIMTQYYGMDWSALWNLPSKGASECNFGRNALVQNNYGTVKEDSYDISPYEVVFHKRGGSLRYLCAPIPGIFGESSRCENDIVVEDISGWVLNYISKTAS